ncbi:gfo/Idh/MocA family oxidoreductase [Acutalibacter sp. 1XD8-33]|uniref:Gfo/Idh/MocA family protein n=1 Tax=Acutalibacter sp. 1XD8-33 TaxID=2320081 RepID=UPI000EA2C15E|nr:Gfo/Idh/MocA family oxidoreductase [Acutalibacter sp. 1XD8-33]RKJ41813.1 gfo/Idh/MocA family oxidoreductase [Acutalibacter sp. 1XD8-33]
MENIRFGIAGCGGIAARFAKALVLSAGTELAACAARNLDRAQAFAQAHGQGKPVRAYGNYQELMEDPNVDAVYIATVHTTHAQIAKQAILVGKAVLCEKPFFTNSREAREVIALAREKSVPMMEAFWTRTLPAYRKAKEWIREGKIGDVTLIRAAFCFCNPCTEQSRSHRIWNPEVGGGAMLDIGVYPYEYVTGILEAPPEKFHYTVLPGPTGVDATVAMTLEYPGALAECLASIAGHMDTTARISGTKGYIEQSVFYGAREARLFDNQNRLLEEFQDSQEEGFVHEIAHFVDLLRSGKTESRWIPLADALDFAEKADLVLGALRG